LIKEFILENNQYDQTSIVVNRGNEKEAKSKIKLNSLELTTIILPQQIYVTFVSRPSIGQSNITPWFVWRGNLQCL
jgi:hypothetical protein